MNNKLLDRQAENMHRLTKELLRKYQLRDRNEIICGGISISQCYALDLLGDHGEMTMQALAQKMFLDKSTTSRVVDPLVKRRLVARRFDDSDRRMIFVVLTPAGAKLLAEIRDCQVQSQRQILERIPERQRRQLVESLELLSHAVQDWLTTCCLPQKIQLTTKNERSNHHA
jgi:DNA-binding MarR family transcriptional regulator